MTNSATALCLSACLVVLDYVQVQPVLAAALALLIGFLIGRAITGKAKHGRARAK